MKTPTEVKYDHILKQLSVIKLMFWIASYANLFEKPPKLEDDYLTFVYLADKKRFQDYLVSIYDQSGEEFTTLSYILKRSRDHHATPSL